MIVWRAGDDSCFVDDVLCVRSPLFFSFVSLGSSLPAEDVTVSLPRKHGAVLGLRAFVLSSPYDVPGWLPDVLMALVRLANEPVPIRCARAGPSLLCKVGRACEDGAERPGETHAPRSSPLLLARRTCVSKTLSDFRRTHEVRADKGEEG